jgi:F-type H+-transporting ATPase subunit b
MESIFAYLDLNLVGLLWHSANFLVLLAALWWLFFRPITRLLEERERRVRQSLRQAQEIEAQAAAAEAARAELIAAAHAEAREIRARAEGQAERLLARTRAQAREEADRILERAAPTATAATPGHAPGSPTGHSRNGQDSLAALAVAIPLPR